VFGSNSDRGIGYGSAFPTNVWSAGNDDFHHQPVNFSASLFRGKITFNLRRKPLCVV
jgi:hypothetical protein